MASSDTISCGICSKVVDSAEAGVRASYIGNELRGLCKDCLDFVVSFSLCQSFSEAEKIVKAEPLRFQNLKAKLEIV